MKTTIHKRKLTTCSSTKTVYANINFMETIFCSSCAFYQLLRFPRIVQEDPIRYIKPLSTIVVNKIVIPSNWQSTHLTSEKRNSVVFSSYSRAYRPKQSFMFKEVKNLLEAVKPSRTAWKLVTTDPRNRLFQCFRLRRATFSKGSSHQEQQRILTSYLKGKSKQETSD